MNRMAEWRTPQLFQERLKRPKGGQRLRVAAVAPTPQTECGQLSPLPPSPEPSSPRLRSPLGDITQPYNVSQAVFNSPSLHLTPTPDREAGESPSDLLFTQSRVPSCISRGSPSSTLTSTITVRVATTTNIPTLPFPSPNSRTRRRRNQEMELHQQQRQHPPRAEQEEDTELMDLHKQVEQLGLMLRKQKQAEGPTLKLQVERLTRDKEELCDKLMLKEEQLATFKSALAQLNVEYMKELGDVKEELAVLTDQVSTKSEQYNRVVEEQEENLSKLAALDIEHQKSLKTISGLQVYISDLPAKEEVRQLDIEVAEERSKREEVETRANELERQLAEALFMKRKAEEGRAEQVAINRDLREKGEQMAEQLREVERARIEARGVGQDEVELVVWDKRQLEKQVGELRTGNKVRAEKWEEERAKLQEQVRLLGGLLEETTAELGVSGTDLRLAQGTCQRLEVQLREKKAEVKSLLSRLSTLSSRSSGLQSELMATAKLDGHYARLSRGINKCLAELAGLEELCTEVFDGGNPNVSILLGVRQVEETEAGPPSSTRDDAQLCVEDRLNIVRRQLEEVDKVQDQVKTLRKKIADAYAERLADNMTSCVTQ